MRPEHDRFDVSRRTVLHTAAVGATAGGLAALGRPVAAQDGDGDLAAWLSTVDNADEVVDRTGQDRATVAVGTQANGGAFGFGPAVVRVDPGTTVVWEWTGEGTPHNVVATDGAFESELIGEAGATFEHTVANEGVVRYVCTPHESMGMKGALVVGDVDVSLDVEGGGGTGDGEDDATAGDGSGGGSDGSGGGSDGSGGGSDGATAGPFDYDGWFEDVDNFEGTVDRTGRETVTVRVGAEGNGGNLAFDPPAIQVDPGTTVVWEWTGEGGQHNVVAAEHDVESPLQETAGATYALAFDGAGIFEYVCAPHEAAGMKGAVVVGEPTREAAIDWFRTGLAGLAGAIVAAPFVASELLARRRGDEENPGRPPARHG